ncbi:MAG: sulfatase-like hydrolase/transferase [Candidatus Latescibacterota bacterium]
MLGVEGHPCIQTPTLDALARSGRRYVRAYSEAPLCVPARRALMTGCPPAAAHLNAECTLLAEAFASGDTSPTRWENCILSRSEADWVLTTFSCAKRGGPSGA